jgi:hypothetical protein
MYLYEMENLPHIPKGLFAVLLGPKNGDENEPGYGTVFSSCNFRFGQVHTQQTRNCNSTNTSKKCFPYISQPLPAWQF